MARVHRARVYARRHLLSLRPSDRQYVPVAETDPKHSQQRKDRLATEWNFSAISDLLVYRNWSDYRRRFWQTAWPSIKQGEIWEFAHAAIREPPHDPVRPRLPERYREKCFYSEVPNQPALARS